MNNPINIKTAKIEQLLKDDWRDRSADERRSDSDKRHGQDKTYFEKWRQREKRNKGTEASGRAQRRMVACWSMAQ